MTGMLLVSAHRMADVTGATGAPSLMFCGSSATSTVVEWRWCRGRRSYTGGLPLPEGPTLDGKRYLPAWIHWYNAGCRFRSTNRWSLCSESGSAVYLVREI